MTWTSVRATAAALVAMAALASCSSGDSGTTPTPPTPPKVAVGSVEVSPATSALAPGDTVRLIASVKDAKGAALTGRTVTWSSSAEAVASVATSGLVTAIAAGSATITASVDGVTGTAKVTVSSAIPGQPGDPAVGNITRMPFVQIDAEYKGDHPVLGGMPVSVRTVMVVIKPTATVAELNGMLKQVGATLAGALPGKAGEAAATLALRLPTETHAQVEDALALLRVHPAVLAAGRDVQLTTATISDTNGLHGDWYWDPAGWSVPGMATWGLRAIRMPQAWNLIPQIRAWGATTLRTGVLDEPVDNSHDDLKNRVIRRLLPSVTCTVTPTYDCAHGDHVAGTIGAEFNNKRGIDGVNPFANLVTRPYDNSSSPTSVAGALWGLDDLIRDGAPLRVVNLSLGYNWYQWSNPQSPLVANGAAQTQANTDGVIVASTLLSLINQGFALPLIVAAAGNEGNAFPGAQAQFCSPYANAALVQGVAIITVVENDAATGLGISPAYSVNSSSCLGGHLSAPGTQILSTVRGNTYSRKTGTSMAAPHVTGVAGFLYSLLPGVRPADMRKVLVASAAHPPGPPFNGRPMVDAFAAALELDVLNGDDYVLKRMLDIDDGSEDGNQRIDPFTGAIDTGEAITADATIDMSDFRRWRDWLLAVENDASLRLDGAANHPKRDVNADGLVGATHKEDLFPQGDFNGDGLLSAVLPAVVPGVLKGGGPLTDLQVLQSRFSDPNYPAAVLDTLIDSGDLHLDLAQCQSLPGVFGIEVDIRDSTSNRLRQRRAVALNAGRQIFTVPIAADQKTRLQVKVTQTGGAITTRDTTFMVAPGADIAWAPGCTGISVTFPDSLAVGAEFFLSGGATTAHRWAETGVRSRRLASGNVPVRASNGSSLGEYEIYASTSLTNRSGGILRLAGEVDYLEAEVDTDDNENASITGRLTNVVIRVEISGVPVRWSGSLACGTGVSANPRQGSASAAATASISFGGTALTCAAGSDVSQGEAGGTLTPGVYFLRVEGSVAVAAAASGQADAESEAYWTINFQPQ